MYIKVRVTPGAKKESVIEDGVGGYTISVREPAKQNRANMRVRELIAAAYSVPVSKACIISGHRARTKVISVDN